MTIFQRVNTARLKKWKDDINRKPLVLRGARQVGKTTLVELISREFDYYIPLNLEKEDERNLFENSRSITELVASIFFQKNIPLDAKNVLLFIDEIQNSPKAVAWLRYFYEDAGQYHVIAAGSLLESLIDKQISFPVGRVSYLPVRPFSFAEFISAHGEKQSLEVLGKIPIPDFAHEKLSKLFRAYALTGGMPEIVKKYVETKDILALAPVYDELLTSYSDDIEKYARSNIHAQTLRHVFNHIFREAGSRITFQGFGKSNYKSREIKEAFLTLEKTFLLKLIYPITSGEIPLSPNFKRSPKLQVFDSGFINYVSGIQKEFFGSLNLSDIYRGRIAEHIVGQELLSLNFSMREKEYFWTREKNADAEVDFVFQFENKLIPVEVKSGKAGKLRSLHEFMDRVEHNYAIRVYSEKLSISKSKTRLGKKFHLMNLPFYLVHKIENYLKWFIEEVQKLEK